MQGAVAIHRSHFRGLSPLYQKWIERYEPSLHQLEKMKPHDHKLERKRRISIITPVYNPDKTSLVSAIESVFAQSYENWELCLADDGSTQPFVKKILQNYAREDKRVKIAFGKAHKGISAASNLALSMATGEMIALLDHDDELAPFALHEITKLLQTSEPDVIYSDEDKIDLKGYRYAPFFKPDWSPDLALSYMYPGHLGVYRRALVAKLNGFRDEASGAQDYDLLLRCSEITNRIMHIPKVLYHWRAVPGSAATSVHAKEWALHACEGILNDALRRRGVEGTATQGKWKGIFRVRREILGSPKVSIVIAAKRSSDFIRSYDSVKHHGIETILVTSDPKLIPLKLKGDSTKIVQTNNPNLPEMYNAGAEAARGEQLLFLGDGVALESRESVRAMLEHSQRSEVGVVGGMVLDIDGRVLHAGYVLGVEGIAGSPFKGCRASENGYFSFLNVVRNCMGVSGLFLMMKKSLFIKVGGFDAGYSSSFYDLDLSLRAREADLLNVYTPYAISNTESLEGSSDHDALRFVTKWKLRGEDMYYNPNLSSAIPFEMNYPLFDLKLPTDPAILKLIKTYCDENILQRLYPPDETRSLKKLLHSGAMYLPEVNGRARSHLQEFESKLSLSNPWVA